jgi:hypothetical protein
VLYYSSLKNYPIQVKIKDIALQNAFLFSNDYNGVYFVRYKRMDSGMIGRVRE